MADCYYHGQSAPGPCPECAAERAGNRPPEEKPYVNAWGYTVSDTVKTDELISIKEAAARGIERVRKPIWANPLDHLKIDIIEGKPGPWMHLWCPFNKKCNGRDPVDMLWIAMNYDEKSWLPYTGALPDSAEYVKAVQMYANMP